MILVTDVGLSAQLASLANYISTNQLRQPEMQPIQATRSTCNQGKPEQSYAIWKA